MHMHTTTAMTRPPAARSPRDGFANAREPTERRDTSSCGRREEPDTRLPEQPLVAAEQGNVIVECRLRLRVSGESVVAWKIDFTAFARPGASVDDYPDGCVDGMPAALFAPRSWSKDLK